MMFVDSVRVDNAIGTVFETSTLEFFLKLKIATLPRFWVRLDVYEQHGIGWFQLDEDDIDLAGFRSYIS